MAAVERELAAWEMTGGFVPVRSDAIAVVEIDHEVVIWQYEFGSVSRLDRSGAVVWSLVDGASTVDEIAGTIADVVDVPVDVLREQVLVVVRVLGRSAIIEGIAPAGTPNDRPPPDAPPPQLMADGSWR